jgi:hypothetical protein
MFLSDRSLLGISIYWVAYYAVMLCGTWIAKEPEDFGSESSSLPKQRTREKVVS